MISVIIPSWNAAAFLPTTIDSVMSQIWASVEIIVVNDGSTDSTGRYLEELGDKISVINMDNSGGPSRPRNVGIEHSGGEFISFFDSDDLMEPDKLSKAMEVFTAHPEVDFVFTNFRSIDLDNKVLNRNYLSEYKVFRHNLEPSAVDDTYLLTGEETFRNLLRANFIGTSSVVCRRSIFDEVGLFDEEMKNADDIDMWMRIARAGYRFAFIDKALHSYRITPGGISFRGAERFSAKIKGMENQLPYCKHEEDSRYIIYKISKFYCAKAWLLRKNKQNKEAIENYKLSLKLRFNISAVRGIVITRIKSVLNK
jgi:teichuronic acid biosynthesis glycosyltransferase TuaG